MILWLYTLPKIMFLKLLICKMTETEIIDKTAPYTVDLPMYSCFICTHTYLYIYIPIILITMYVDYTLYIMYARSGELNV